MCSLSCQTVAPQRRTLTRQACYCCYRRSVNRQSETSWNICVTEMSKIHTWQNNGGLFCFQGPTCLPDWIDFTAWLTVFLLQSNVSMPKYRRALWCVPHGSYLKSPSHFDAAWQGFITCAPGQMSWHELLLNLQIQQMSFLQRFWQFAATKKLLEVLSTCPALIKKMVFMVIFKNETPFLSNYWGHFTHANIITAGRKLCPTWSQSGKGGYLHRRSIKLQRV